MFYHISKHLQRRQKISCRAAYFNPLLGVCGGAVASWLVHSSPDRALLAGDLVLCSWARHYSHSASLHPGL